MNQLTSKLEPININVSQHYGREFGLTLVFLDAKNYHLKNYSFYMKLELKSMAFCDHSEEANI